jgi:hypothetical protein
MRGANIKAVKMCLPVSDAVLTGRKIRMFWRKILYENSVWKLPLSQGRNIPPKSRRVTSRQRVERGYSEPQPLDGYKTKPDSINCIVQHRVIRTVVHTRRQLRTDICTLM